MTAQLPTPGGDDGTWGDILNGYLLISHNSDGTLQSAAVQQAGAITIGGDLSGTVTGPTVAKIQGTAINASTPANGQVLAYNSTSSAWVPSTVTSTTVSDATTSSKGIVELTGDISGTATNVTVTSTHLSSALPVNQGGTGSTTAAGARTSLGTAASGANSDIISLSGLTTPLSISQGGTGSAAQNFLTLGGDLGNTVTAPKVQSIQGVAVSGAASNGLSLVATSSSAATWAAVAGSTDWVNVKTYGAKGDGTTNDATAIQNAINAAGSGVVYFPVGTYLLGASLTMTTACTFQGAGRDASILTLANGVNDYAIKFTQTSGAITAAHFADFQINGNAINQTAGGGISAVGAVQCAFERLHMTSCFNWGIYFQPQPGGAFGHHNRVTGCLFDNAAAAGNGGGVLITSCDENFFYGCDFEYLGGTVAPAGAGSNPVCLLDEAGLQQITSCCFVGSRGSSTNVIGIRVQNAAKSRIIGCTFDGVGGDSVLVAGTDCVIVGNHFSSIGAQGTAGASAGVHLEYGNLRNTVTGNNFISASTNGQTGWLIYEQQIGSSGSNVIADNTLYVLGTCATAALQTSGIASLVRGNVGYNPVGHVTSPTIPSTGTALVNPFNVDAMVFVTGGTVTAIAIGGTATGQTSGQFIVPAGQSITLTYSAAPTWTWFGN